MSNLEQIKINLEKLENEINETCIKYSKERSNILLLPISKYHTLEEIECVYNLGFNDFGENRVQELITKMNNIQKDINWHMVGSLQTNKVKYIIDKVKLIHSLDRIKLAKEINKRARKKNLIVECLIQINISKEDSKHGIYLKNTENLIEEISRNYDNVKVKGLMTIAEHTDNDKVIEDMFNSIHSKFIDIRNKKLHNVDMKYLSMGMSNDYKLAIKHGANILRIGTKIFGKRKY